MNSQISLLATIQDVSTAGPTTTSAVTAVNSSTGCSSDDKVHSETGVGAATINLTTEGFASVSSVIVVCTSGSITLESTGGSTLDSWPTLAILTAPGQYVLASAAQADTVSAGNNQIRIGGTGAWTAVITGVAS